MELRQYFAVVRKYLWLILLTTLLATGSAFYVGYTAPLVYRATTTLEIDLGTNPLSDPYAVSNVRTVESVTEVFSARVQFSSFLQEVKDRLGLQMSVATIQDQLPAAPVGSRLVQNTLLGGATGLMIGLGLAFLLDYLDDTIRSPEDVKRGMPVGVLGALPVLKEHTHNGAEGGVSLVVTQYPLQPVSEAFRNLRTSVEFSSLDHPGRTLLVTSPLPYEGKTFTSANLAGVIAQGGKSVVLIDADLRHPRVHRTFGLSREPGLTGALFSPDRRAQALRPTEVEGLRVVTSGASPPNPAEMLASERMRDFVTWVLEKDGDRYRDL